MQIAPLLILSFISDFGYINNKKQSEEMVCIYSVEAILSQKLLISHFLLLDCRDNILAQKEQDPDPDQALRYYQVNSTSILES